VKNVEFIISTTAGRRRRAICISRTSPDPFPANLGEITFKVLRVSGTRPYAAAAASRSVAPPAAPHHPSALLLLLRATPVSRESFPCV